MKTTNLLAICLSLYLGMQTASYAYQIYDPGCTADVYTVYTGASGEASRMTSDSSGNLYITHTNAQVDKITSDKSVIKNWATGFTTPWSIEDASGTSYGDKLYVTECGSAISTISFSGVRSTFTTLSNASGLAIDRQGSYGGSMFAGTTSDDLIYRISTSGSKTTFCSYFSSMSGGIASLAFDSSGKYGGAMYAATWSPTDSRSGIYAISTTGAATRFCSNMIWASAIQFDDPDGLFGGDMFVTGKLKSTDSLQLYRVGTDGIATLFMQCSGEINGFTFGADGALYVHEYYSGVSNIIRVVPEPATLALLSLGLLAIRRKK